MNLSKYQTEIESIAAHARAINFNASTGNFDELFQSWIEAGRKFIVSVNDNQEDVLGLMKTLCNK